MTQSSQMPALAPEDAGTAKTVTNHLYQSFCYRGPKKALDDSATISTQAREGGVFPWWPSKVTVTDRHKGDIVLSAWEAGCGSSKHLFSGYINRLCAHLESWTGDTLLGFLSHFAALGTRNGFFPVVSPRPHLVAQADWEQERRASVDQPQRSRLSSQKQQGSHLLNS